MQLPNWLTGFTGVLIICITCCIAQSIFGMVWARECFSKETNSEGIIACRLQKLNTLVPQIVGAVMCLLCLVSMIVAGTSSASAPRTYI